MTAAIRASYTKLGLRHVRRHPLDPWARLVAVAGEGALADVRSAGKLEWMPAELHGLIADAVIEVLGRPAARALWADVLIDAFSHPVLSPIVGGALRLYGKSPPSVMRMTPHAWPLFFHDCGRSWMEPAGEDHATMSFAELPHAIIASTGILDGFLANCDAALRHTGFDGSATPSYDQLAEGRFSIDVRWHKL